MQKILRSDWTLITLLAIAKLVIHLITIHNYELHRDAYLYYAQSEHLDLGYVAVPPFIAFVGKVATSLFGNTTFALRLFPALIGAVNVIIIGAFVRNLGGKKIAIAVAGLAYLLSPAYLHTNALFQPVAFNHFYWLLSGYLIYKLIRTQHTKYWIWISVVFALGFLNKYSIVFLFAAFGIAILLSRYRKLIFDKYFLAAVVLALILISPNLIWQYQNNWPVLQHMDELRSTQLVHVNPSDFIFDQLLMNAHALLLWVGALLMLLFHKKERPFLIFGLIYLLVFGLLLAGSGKSYYTLGVYPILFVFGAYFLQKYLEKHLFWLFPSIVVFMGLGLYISFSFDGIPFLTFEQAKSKDAFRWEDGQQYDIPQDMADMTGWKEIGETVRDLYIEIDQDADIFCYHYGQAGAIMFYGKEIQIPQPISTNGSFAFWSPDSLVKEDMIFVHSDLGNTINPDSLLGEFFEKYELKKIIDNSYFRENGTRIYHCQGPKAEAKQFYAEMMAEAKARYKRDSND